MLLGLGNVGGIMRNNGRFTAAEENIALGAPDRVGRKPNEKTIWTNAGNTGVLLEVTGTGGPNKQVMKAKISMLPHLLEGIIKIYSIER